MSPGYAAGAGPLADSLLLDESEVDTFDKKAQGSPGSVAALLHNEVHREVSVILHFSRR